jgi:hypothetical protein
VGVTPSPAGMPLSPNRSDFAYVRLLKRLGSFGRSGPDISEFHHVRGGEELDAIGLRTA